MELPLSGERKITKGRVLTFVSEDKLTIPSIISVESIRIRSYLSIRQERTYDFADGEGFEPPVFLSRLRFSRPINYTGRHPSPERFARPIYPHAGR